MFYNDDRGLIYLVVVAGERVGRYCGSGFVGLGRVGSIYTVGVGAAGSQALTITVGIRIWS